MRIGKTLIYSLGNWWQHSKWQSENFVARAGLHERSVAVTGRTPACGKPVQHTRQLMQRGAKTKRNLTASGAEEMQPQRAQRI